MSFVFVGPKGSGKRSAAGLLVLNDFEDREFKRCVVEVEMEKNTSGDSAVPIEELALKKLWVGRHR
jgi:hypothetical protein